MCSTKTLEEKNCPWKHKDTVSKLWFIKCKITSAEAKKSPTGRARTENVYISICDINLQHVTRLREQNGFWQGSRLQKLYVKPHELTHLGQLIRNRSTDALMIRWSSWPLGHGFNTRWRTIRQPFCKAQKEGFPQPKHGPHIVTTQADGDARTHVTEQGVGETCFAANSS